MQISSEGRHRPELAIRKIERIRMSPRKNKDVLTKEQDPSSAKTSWALPSQELSIFCHIFLVTLRGIWGGNIASLFSLNKIEGISIKIQ